MRLGDVIGRWIGKVEIVLAGADEDLREGRRTGRPRTCATRSCGRWRWRRAGARRATRRCWSWRTWISRTATGRARSSGSTGPWKKRGPAVAARRAEARLLRGDARGAKALLETDDEILASLARFCARTLAQADS